MWYFCFFFSVFFSRVSYSNMIDENKKEEPEKVLWLCVCVFIEPSPNGTDPRGLFILYVVLFTFFHLSHFLSLEFTLYV